MQTCMSKAMQGYTARIMKGSILGNRKVLPQHATVLTTGVRHLVHDTFMHKNLQHVPALCHSIDHL